MTECRHLWNKWNARRSCMQNEKSVAERNDKIFFLLFQFFIWDFCFRVKLYDRDRNVRGQFTRHHVHTKSFLFVFFSLLFIQLLNLRVTFLFVLRLGIETPKYETPNFFQLIFAFLFFLSFPIVCRCVACVLCLCVSSPTLCHIWFISISLTHSHSRTYEIEISFLPFFIGI